jgi:chromosome partitioning protein
MEFDAPLARELQNLRQRRSAAAKLPYPRPPRPRVISITNQKGGVGKTTSVVNLAAALARAGLRVLVLDLDPQGNASSGLGLDIRSGAPGIYEVLIGANQLADVVVGVEESQNLSCAPSSLDLAGAEIELVDLKRREFRLRDALSAYWRTHPGAFDYVLIDCPPSLGLLTVNAFVAASEVLIPIQCEYYALEGLSQLLHNVSLVNRSLNPQLRVTTILLTMYDSRTRLAADVAGQVRSTFPQQTLQAVIPRSVRVSEAPSYGSSVIEYDGGSKGAIAYLEAASELAVRGADHGA